MKNKEITRRSFIAATLASAGVGALALSGCNSVQGNNSQNKEDEVKVADCVVATVAYSATNYNPIGNSSALMISAGWHVFEGLYDLDMSTYKPYNALAASEPTKISDTVFEVTLRDDAKFSDGSNVTAHDVVNAYVQNMQSETYKSLLAFIGGVSAKSDNVVRFELNYPFDALLKKRLSIVKIFPRVLSQEQLNTMPIGSGPWKFEEIDGRDGGRIVFAANEQYNGQKTTQNAKMEWKIACSGDTRGDTSSNENVVAIEDVVSSSVDKIKNASMTVEYVPGFAQAFLLFNTKKAPFDDKHVRQAIFYAIDVDKLISSYLAGHAKAVTSFLPETYSNYHKASTIYSYDPERARNLLAEAKCTDLSLTLKVNNNWVKSFADQIKENLESIGIATTLQIEDIDWTALDESGGTLPFDVILTPGDPSCFGNDPDLLMTWWYGDNVWTSGRSCWKDAPEWATLQGFLQSARTERDATKQQSIWNDCFDLIAENCPIYPLMHKEIGSAYRSDKLENFNCIGCTGLSFVGAKALK